MLKLFWSLAHSSDVTTDIMDQALAAHVKILDYSCTQYREQQKNRWLDKCVEELKANDKWVLPALKQIKEICSLYHEHVSECDGDFQEERTLLPLHRVARGKKDLPRSFLDRFSKVFMAALSPGDLGLICSSLYPCHHNWRTSATPWAAPPPSSPICTA